MHEFIDLFLRLLWFILYWMFQPVDLLLRPLWFILKWTFLLPFYAVRGIVRFAILYWPHTPPTPPAIPLKERVPTPEETHSAETQVQFARRLIAVRPSERRLPPSRPSSHVRAREDMH
jgi:hypothetical protein